ncbi:MAG: 50S ribosomal protein L4 [Candidatus Methanomethylophilus sp.]|jgi:large subunit ribosomal protein L4e|nr:50S ribosomal protein L4 [Methanomethylophilus sp.]MDD3232729.1 50S ribosomal protein L4 [Methanomethylophilus sp.]MDD4221738.1 50S ribosomal protein L4 [Methanomethylophilus sp.]MDD4668414.1 50S ribosomal protein L4 [Methanomethylophilus sp.]
MTTVNVYSVKGEVAGTVDVPAAFSAEYRPDLIKKAILAAAANGRQPYGPNKRAGMRHSVSTWGKGRGVARVQRLADGRRATQSPNNVSGRRAHPPKVERIWAQKVNKKELKLARLSALAATANAECVKARGHKFDDKVTFPIVVEDDFQDLTTAKEVGQMFDVIGIGYDLDRAKEGTKIRAGRGKMRNRKYRSPVSVLIVVSDREVPVFKGAQNLPGVEVEDVRTLNTSLLAPGGDAGRLAVYTKSAIEKIGEWTE